MAKFSLNETNILTDQTPIYMKHLQLIIDKEPAIAMNFINQHTAPSHERNN